MSIAEFDAFLDTEDAQFIMGLPNFSFGAYAHLWRATGAEIKARAEDEQAFFIALLLKLAFVNRETWRDEFSHQVQARQSQVEAQDTGTKQAAAPEAK